MSTPTLRWLCLAAACLALAACGGDQHTYPADATPDPVAPSGGDAMPDPVTPPGGDATPPMMNSAPQISGTPDDAAIVGATWRFEPAASDADGDPLHFQITNAPTWTRFDQATGLLEGMPGDSDVATWSEISITVTDGLEVAELPTFSIDVHTPESATGNATLSWTPPTERIDGSPIGELAGYRVLYGQDSLDYQWTAEITNPSVTRFVVENLTPGRWYFAVSAVAADGLQSAPSAEVSKLIEG